MPVIIVLEKTAALLFYHFHKMMAGLAAPPLRSLPAATGVLPPAFR